MLARDSSKPIPLLINTTDRVVLDMDCVWRIKGGLTKVVRDEATKLPSLAVPSCEANAEISDLAGASKGHSKGSYWAGDEAEEYLLGRGYIEARCRILHIHILGLDSIAFKATLVVHKVDWNHSLFCWSLSRCSLFGGRRRLSVG